MNNPSILSKRELGELEDLDITIEQKGWGINNDIQRPSSNKCANSPNWISNSYYHQFLLRILFVFKQINETQNEPSLAASNLPLLPRNSLSIYMESIFFKSLCLEPSTNNLLVYFLSSGPEASIPIFVSVSVGQEL